MAEQVKSGWYADPEGSTFLRFWDGTQWTSKLLPPANPTILHEPVEVKVSEAPSEDITSVGDRKDEPLVAPLASEEEAIELPAADRLGQSQVEIPEVPPEAKAGLFGRKKALEEEVQQLRAALDSMGLIGLQQLRDETESLELKHKQESTAHAAALQKQLKAHAEELAKQNEASAAALKSEESELRDKVQELRGELADLKTETVKQRAEVNAISSNLITVSDYQMLQEVGIYEYRHPLDSAVAYKGRLSDIKDQYKTLVKQGAAVTGSTNWTVNGSTTQGSKMVKEFSKLMLRAYNNEADNAVRSMKAHALASSIDRLDKVREIISKLGRTMNIEVTDQYHRLRIEELELTADYLAKAAEEKEEQREERARLKEEEKAQRELEREKEKLEKEAFHYATVVASLRASGDEAAALAAESKLAEINSAIEGVEERAANTRAGYVYVISNFGSFGERMVKIGMTRRLDPMDRVRELGDASVPFRYDVHAVIFSDDAVGLENKLHRRLSQNRVNLVNLRREFFYATPSEVRDALAEFKHDLLSFEELPEAIEWHQSENMRAVPTSETETPQ